MTDALIVAGFAAWFLATALFQLGKTPLNRVEWYGFIPNCRFFCPDPIITDVCAYHAASDAADDDLKALVWRPLVEPRLPRLLPIWNPGHRLQKSVNVMAPWLVQFQETAPARAHYTLPYLRLLNVAAQATAGDDARFTRFIVTRHRGRASTDRQILFQSRAHSV